jgi:exonuclease SbcC
VIQRILRMDYKTFTNSAYSQQGRADEFTKQTVADRKKILADILDLSRYDALEQKAKDRRNEAESLVQEFERDIAHIEQELANEPGYQEELAKSKAERDSLESEITRVETRLRELQGIHAELQTTLNRVRELERSVQGWESEIRNLQSQKHDQEMRVARSRQVLNDKERITTGLERLRLAREKVASLDRGLRELRALEHEKAGLEQQIVAEKHKLDIEHQSLAKELSELESRVAQSAALEKDALVLSEQVKSLDEMDARRTKLQSDAASENEKWTNLKGQYERMLQVKEDLTAKVTMLGESAECPLCRTELGHEKH